MPIQLIDIPRAVTDYQNNEVLTFVEDFDGTLSPGEDKQGEVIVQNGVTTTALRLINSGFICRSSPVPAVIRTLGTLTPPRTPKRLLASSLRPTRAWSAPTT